MRFIHSYEPSGKSTPQVRRANLEKFLAYAKKDMARPTVLKMAYSGWITTPQALQLDASFLRDYHLYSEIHYLESPVNQQTQRDNFKYITAVNILGPNVSFGHFIHPDDAILKTVAAAGSGMVWNPMSNGRLASGIADIPKYRKMGIKVGMGVDGEGSSDLPDPFENMRMGLYVIRAKYESAKILQPIDVLRFHTMGSAEVLGVADKVGSLEVGKFGDIIIVDPKLVERGPVVDPYAAVVLACNAMNLAKVYVGGDLLVDTYRLQKNDMSKVSREVNQRVARSTLGLMAGKYRIGRRDFFKQAAGAIGAATQIPHWSPFAEARPRTTSHEAAERSRFPASSPANSSRCSLSRWAASLPEAWPLEGEVSCAIGRSSIGPTRAFLRHMPFPRSGSKPGMRSPSTRVLEARILPPYEGQDGLGSNNSPGLSRIATAEFTAQYPLAHLQFKDPSLPVKIELDAFSPFIPHDPDASGLPVAILRYRVSNPARSSASVAHFVFHRQPGQGPLQNRPGA